MEKHYRESIAAEFYNCVANTIERLKGEETYRPFHAALLSDEALFWSRFERSFSTSFGQRVIEEISKAVVLAGGATEASRQKVSTVTIDSATDEAITAHMHTLRTGKKSAGWQATIAEIAAKPRSGKNVEPRVISDLWWFKNDTNHYLSIKTVKPNIDQTAVAKEDLLRLTLADPSCKAYFGLYYNPYGEDKSAYNHTPPMGIFDFHNDEAVLIGKEYWDTLGGPGSYEIILQIARDVGAKTRVLLKDLKQR